MPYRFKYLDCNICGSNERKYVGKRIPRSCTLAEERIVDVVKCRSCNLIYPYPMPFADEKEIQKNFNDPNTYFPRAVSQERFKFYDAIVEKISCIVGKKGKLLDIGCGRGELLYRAKKYGWDVTGVDISSSFAKYAKSEFDIDIKVGDIKKIDFPNDIFDAACLISVLDHVSDPKGVLIKINKILRKGGVIFIEVMNNESMLYVFGDIYYLLKGKKITTRLSPTFPSFQLYGFSTKSILYLLRITGFKVVELKIKGGISKTERKTNSTCGEKILKSIRDLCIIFAELLNRGQVLEVYAEKNIDFS